MLLFQLSSGEYRISQTRASTPEGRNLLFDKYFATNCTSHSGFLTPRKDVTRSQKTEAPKIQMCPTKIKKRKRNEIGMNRRRALSATAKYIHVQRKSICVQLS